MAFNIFSQPQGPRIDPNLFPQAANAGISGGNALGTQFSNAVEGAIKGIQQGQEIAIRANQIEQLPVENEIRRQQAELYGLKLEQAQAAKDLALENERAELQNNIEKSRFQTNVLKRRSEFDQIFRQATPEEQEQLVLGGQYDDVFAQDRNLYQQSLQRLYLNTKNPELRERLDAYFRKGRISQVGEAQRVAWEGKYNGLKNEVDSDPIGLKEMLPDLTPSEFPKAVVFEPAGKYKADADGNLVYDRNGQPLFDENFDGSKKAVYVDVLNADRTKVLKRNVDPKVEKLYDDFKNAEGYVSGQYTERALKQEETRQQAAQKQPASIVGNFPQPSAQPQRFSPAVSLVQRTFALSPETTEKLEPSIKQMADTIDFYVKMPSSRVQAQKNLNMQMQTIARSITDAAFDASPALQAQYTQREVDLYNLSLSAPGVNPALLDPYKVTTPKDLYYQNQKGSTLDYLNGVVQSIQTDVQRRLDQPLDKQRANQANQAFLQKVKNGTGAVTK